MAEVRFLDGPLRGQVRAIPEYSDGRPREVVHPTAQFDGSGAHATLRGQMLTYRIKRSYYSEGPAWVAAIGRHCGDPIAVVVPFAREMRDLGAAFTDLIDRAGRAELARFCANAGGGLVLVEVRELFRGSLVKAKRLSTTRNEPLALVAGMLADIAEVPDLQVSVWSAICEVEP